MADAIQEWWADKFFMIQARREADAALFRHMVQVRDRYNSPMVFPLTDVDGEPEVYAPTPMILGDAIDSHAARANSQRPGIICPALDRTKPRGQKSLEYAGYRRDALRAHWYQDGLIDLMMPRAYRHDAGYGTFNMIVTPDFTVDDARIELRDPLTAYPELRAPEDTRPPLNCVYVHGKSTAWLAANYPETRAWIGESGCDHDDLWDVAEWVDEKWCAVGLLGPRKVAPSGNVYWGGTQQNPNQSSYTTGQLLRRWPNRADMVPIGTSRRATLDQIFGQVAQMVPITDMYGKLAALNMVAAEREVFPDLALIGNQIGRVPTLEGGVWRDGRTGDINTVLDGDVKVLNASPGPMTRAALADVERSIRQSTGQSGILSGDPSFGSVRSGNQIDAFSALTQDPRLLESHRRAQRALTVVNEAVLATKKGYWPKKKYVVFAGGTDDGVVEYTPETHFETYLNAVAYPIEGMDAGAANISLLQLSSSGMESKRAIRHKHPLIEDADRAHREVLIEQAEEAMAAAYSQHIFEGATPLKFARAYVRALKEGKDIEEAIEASDKLASEIQSTPAATPAEAAPGIQPALGAGQPPAPIPGPTDGQTNLEQLLYTLGQPQKQAS